jgi:NAD+ kinase
MKIALVPNPNKADAVNAATRLLTLLSPRPDIEAVVLLAPSHDELQNSRPDLIVVLGGDGSILGTAQSLGEINVPVAGINFGKLGYLAAFSLEQFLHHLDALLAGRLPSTRRLMLKASIYKRLRIADDPLPEDFHNLPPRVQGLALNDVVINAGDPFRMVELTVRIDGHATTTFRSDGVILSTASGSTGYNLSAGGPLLSPDVEAMVLTPICPHSLSFRPVVLSAASTVVILPCRLNPGSKVTFDGQMTHPIADDEVLVITRAPTPLTLLENPATTHWQMLARKLHWAQNPRQ